MQNSDGDFTEAVSFFLYTQLPRRDFSYRHEDSRSQTNWLLTLAYNEAAKTNTCTAVENIANWK